MREMREIYMYTSIFKAPLKGPRYFTVLDHCQAELDHLRFLLRDCQKGAPRRSLQGVVYQLLLLGPKNPTTSYPASDSKYHQIRTIVFFLRVVAGSRKEGAPKKAPQEYGGM